MILVDQPETQRSAVRAVRAAWEACGARIVRLDARSHDEIFAAVSHLPHVVAFALVSMLAKRRNASTLLGFSGGGLRDTVRIAGSSPEMWRDICIANREALVDLLDDYTDELEIARAAILSGDADALTDMFERARTARVALAAQRAVEAHVTHLDLRAHRVGAAARCACRARRAFPIACSCWRRSLKAKHGCATFSIPTTHVYMLEALRALGVAMLRGKRGLRAHRRRSGSAARAAARSFTSATPAPRSGRSRLCSQCWAATIACPALRACTSVRSATWSTR